MSLFCFYFQQLFPLLFSVNLIVLHYFDVIQINYQLNSNKEDTDSKILYTFQINKNSECFLLNFFALCNGCNEISKDSPLSFLKFPKILQKNSNPSKCPIKIPFIYETKFPEIFSNYADSLGDVHTYAKVQVDSLSNPDFAEITQIG